MMDTNKPSSLSYAAHRSVKHPRSFFPSVPRHNARGCSRARAAFLFLLAFSFYRTSVLRADTIIKIDVGGDLIAMPEKGTQTCQPCVAPARPGDSVTLFASEDRLRRDRGPMSIILRKDAKKVFFLCQTTKQYAELDYPVKAKQLEHKMPIPIEDEFRQFRITGSSASGKSQFKQWQVGTFDATVANGFRDQFRLHLAVADIGGASGTIIMEFTKLLNDLQHEGHGWSQLLPFEHGVPVVLEEAQRQPGTEFLYKEEVSEVTEKETQAETYELPSGYKKVRFDTDCIRVR
jgi:hypothetical protein